MQKLSRKWLISGSLVLVAVFWAALYLAFAPDEPTHGGKKLSVWLDELAALDYSKRGEPLTKEAQAVRAIGTNALPWLLREMRARGSRTHYLLNQVLDKQPLIKFRFPDVNRRLSRATLGFQTLGELAEPSIPELLNLVEDKPGYVPAALAGIGPRAVPALQQCLTNVRSYATSVGQIAPIPGNTIGAIRNAISAGRLPRPEAAIRDWSQSTNRNPAQYDYAARFLQEFDN